MVRRRFFASPTSFAPDGSTVDLGADETRHLRDVLRLRSGDEVFVFDGEGREVRCAVKEIGRDSVTLEIKSEVEPARPESPLQLTIAVALLKGEKFDLVVQKVTELGASRVVPVISKLADVRLRDEADGEKRVARLQRIALEACKQSGRARVPRIATPIAFSALIEGPSSSDNERRLMFSERDGQSLSEVARSLHDKTSAMTALVGSEGGWTNEELEEASKSGWSLVTLGGRVLRAETAAIAATALLQHQFGDLR